MSRNFENEVVNGFKLIRKIGEGGMAEVWFAENKIGKTAAVKILKEEYSKMQDLIARFENEAKAMVSLEHPGIRQVLDFEFIDDRPCIIMEYLEGDDLKDLLNKGRIFSDNELQNFWNQCVSALNYTHEKGIIHRDIKPSNIFLTTDNKVKLLDFGIAKVMDNITLTQTGTRMGTLLYMSPEQVKDSKHLNYKSDVYSLAVTFYHLLTGVAPYNSDSTSAFDIQTKIVHEDLDLSAIPLHWQAFLKPFLQKNAENRAELHYFTDNSNDSPTKNEETIFDTTLNNGNNTKKEETPTIKQPKKQPEKQPEEPKVKKKNKWLLPVVGIVAISLITLLIVLNTGGKNKNDSNENADANDQSIKLPEVHTEKATQIGTNTAKLSGNVSDDGNGNVSERGIVYSTSANPTTSNTKMSAGTGTGNFEVTLNNLNSDTKYHVRAYAINEKGTAYGDDISFTTSQKEQISTKLKIGDTHAGGIIFYLDGTGQHGLVCAPYDQSTGAVWGCSETITDGTATYIGSGQANTQKIVNACSQSGIAARICNNLVLNGYSDWFLPSKDELKLMYENLKQRGLGNFRSEWYWSSSEYNVYEGYEEGSAWGLHFSGGLQVYIVKSITYYVRAVRAF